MRSALRLTALILMALVLGSEVAVAGMARFSGPPEIGDRRITWNWEPLPPGVDELGADPYFQGNTVIELNETTSIPERLKLLRTNGAASRLYGLAEDNRIRIYDSSGNNLLTLDPPPSPILDLDVREVNYDALQVLILAGLEDGRVAVWSLGQGVAPILVDSQASPCRFARFLVASNSVQDGRFVTAGDEDTIRVWADFGAIRFRIPTGGGNPVSSLAITQNAFFMAAGDRLGTIRIYRPLREPTVFESWSAHEAEVSRLVFSRDTKILVSADVTGKVIVWSTRDWSKVTEVQLDSAASPTIGVREPDAILLYTIEPNGLFSIFDGRSGRLYNQRQLTSGSAISTTDFGNQGRLVLVAQEDRSILTWRTGFCVASSADPSCFGGYMIWRSPTPRAEDAVLQRIFGFGDSTWTFVGDRRQFVDPDSMIERGAHPVDENHPLEPVAGPHNGIPYYYSITSFARRFLGGSTFTVGNDPQSIYDGFYRVDPNGPPTAVLAHGEARKVRPFLSDVVVVPNPYEAGKVVWDPGLGQHVEFRNLPEQATIEIYTMGGDLLRTLEHGRGEFGESSDAQSWDLKNASGRDVASGVYIYRIETKLNRETTEGYFTIIR